MLLISKCFEFFVSFVSSFFFFFVLLLIRTSWGGFNEDVECKRSLVNQRRYFFQLNLFCYNVFMLHTRGLCYIPYIESSTLQTDLLINNKDCVVYFSILFFLYNNLFISFVYIDMNIKFDIGGCALQDPCISNCCVLFNQSSRQTFIENT